MKSFKEYINEMPMFHKEQQDQFKKFLYSTGQLCEYVLPNVIKLMEEILGKPMDPNDPNSGNYGKRLGAGYSRVAFHVPVPRARFTEKELSVIRDTGLKIDEALMIDTVIKIPKDQANMKQNTGEYNTWIESEGKPLRRWLNPIIATARDMIDGANENTELFMLQSPLVIPVASEQSMSEGGKEIMNQEVIPWLVDYFGKYSKAGSPNMFEWNSFNQMMKVMCNSPGSETKLTTEKAFLEELEYLGYPTDDKEPMRIQRAQDYAIATRDMKDLRGPNIGMINDNGKYRPVILDYGYEGFNLK